jgi:phospholipase A2
MQALLYSDEDFTDGPGKDKTMCIVDSGIAFNSPFPAMLRPERKVELILSFDFSQRDGGDKELPFKVSVFQYYIAVVWKRISTNKQCFH